MINASFFLWPLVALGLFRKLPLPAAIVATILGGYLVLPTQGGWDLPGIMLDKDTLPAVAALILALALARSYSGPVQPGWLPRSPMIVALIVALLAGHVGTWLTNTTPLVYGSRVQQGLTMMDAFAGIIRALVMIVPFLLARKYLASREGHRIVLIVTVACMSFYALLALYEVRMSPQLNNMLYGYFPHAWKQHIRAGGFRPLVFLSHGLVLGVMLSCAVLMAFGLWQSDRTKHRGLYLAVALYLLGTLFLAKTIGALAVTLVLLPVLLFTPMRLQVLLAGCIVVIVLMYPILRSSNVIPTTEIVQRIETYSYERASSLRFRFEQEDQLLAKAKERRWFGWGGYGRSRVIAEDGTDVSTPDGRWVISMGLGGWTRYVSEIGLASIAVLILALGWRRYQPDRETVALAVALTANLIDLIPNSGMTPLTWLMAGALAGRLEVRQTTPDLQQAADAVPGAGGPRMPPQRAPATVGYRRALGKSAPTVQVEAVDDALKGPRASRFAPRKAGQE